MDPVSTCARYFAIDTVVHVCHCCAFIYCHHYCFLLCTITKRSVFSSLVDLFNVRQKNIGFIFVSNQYIYFVCFFFNPRFLFKIRGHPEGQNFFIFCLHSIRVDSVYSTYIAYVVHYSRAYTQRNASPLRYVTLVYF